MLTEEKKKEIKKFAKSIRLETMKELGNLGFGHIGGSMSIVELLAVLYGEVMNVDPKNPKMEGRDWLVVSKGHSGPAVYATLALKGYFDKELLKTLNKGGTDLPSHCDRNHTRGIDMSTGSLGQGISMALGIAVGNALDKRDNFVYAILGDGECQEGQVWEAFLYAGNHPMKNLIVFVDNNKQQLDGYTDDINSIGDIRTKIEDFGWFSQEVDGHNVEQIYEAIKRAQSSDKSSAIVLDTIKGKGCSFAEGVELNHHMKFKKEQMDEAIEVLLKEGDE